MNSLVSIRIRIGLLCAATAFTCAISGCHSGKSKHEEPVVEAPRAPVVGNVDRAASRAGSSSSTAFDPNAPAIPDPRPVEQNVTLKVKAEEAKTITQPIALDVKFAKQPTLEVPVSLNLTAPSEAERKIPVAVTFTVDSSKPITVPIRFQAEGGLQVPGGNRVVSGAPSASGDGTTPGGNNSNGATGGGDSGSIVSARNFTASYVYDPALIPIKLLAAMIGSAALVGGIVRTIQSRRNVKRALQSGREWSQLSFDERVRLMEQQYQAIGAGEQILMLLVNILWGAIAAVLVPAVLVICSHPLLIQISDSRPHLIALFGFCLLAATVGAELLVLVQRMLQRAFDGTTHAPQTHSTTAYSTSSE